MRSKTLKPSIRWWSLFNPGLLAHFTESLEVHSDRFVHRRGVFSKQKNVIHFSYIINYSTCQSVVDRVFGSANFCIETTAHPEVPVLELKGYPNKLRDFLSKMMRAYASGELVKGRPLEVPPLGSEPAPYSSR